MFTKKVGTPEVGEDGKVTRKVVTETVEKSGGVQTKTTTITCSEKDLDMAFHKLHLDPEKFRSGGTTITRQIIYSNSSGVKEVFEETEETFDEPTGAMKPRSLQDSKEAIASEDSPSTKAEDSNDCGSKGSKSFLQKFGIGSKKDSKKEPEVKKIDSMKAEKFAEECLKTHNEYRSKHGVPALELSEDICAYSQEWADHLAATDSFKHRSEHKYGENIFMKWSSDPKHTVTGREAVESWYSEIKDYTFGYEPKTLKSGHFTQVVWRGSQRLGAAWSRSKSGKVLVVANYDPPGNFVSKFTENVPPPKS